MSFRRILIANRGEIACRVIRTARAMGYATVAVFSDADRDAPHVALADEALCIGPPPVRESYLSIPALVGAAIRAGADAVHPGYGFLSENATFAQACLDAGLIFIGPPPAAIDAMGNKSAAKRRMIDAGVPCVPGYQGADQGESIFEREAQRIGFPVMVKAAAGGGGRGMRLVTRPEDLAAAIAGARSEAENAFGSGELLLEKAVVEPRHVEIQVFADRHGNVIHLGERDCSIQRRHQKVVEEAPSPAVSTELRQAMGEAAVAAARAIDYVGAGTVEFLLDPAGAFYFLEMNTRLQVEHPVTEQITGVDLVEWQLRVAAGERLPLEQHEVRLRGHAIEVRLYAEDPFRGFLPQTGRVALWQPATGTGMRIDDGIRTGQEITPHYDPMLAKVIGYGASREEARRRLVRALEQTTVFGPVTNKSFLIRALEHPEFVAGGATTAFIERHFAAGSAAMTHPAPTASMIALAAALLIDMAGGLSRERVYGGFRSNGPQAQPLVLDGPGGRIEATAATLGPGRYIVRSGDDTHEIGIIARDGSAVQFEVDGHLRRAVALFDGDCLFVEIGGRMASFRDLTLLRSGSAEAEAESNLLAPMNGRIVGVHAKAGDRVSRGQRLIVLEAMKMQHEIAALRDGEVEQVPVREGDQVATRQLLVALKPEIPVQS